MADNRAEERQADYEEHLAIAREHHWEFVDLDKEGLAISPEVTTLLAPRLARRYNVLPVILEGHKLTIAVEDPSDLAAINEVRSSLSGYTVRTAYANPRAIKRMIEESYSAAREAQGLVAQDSSRKAKPVVDASAGGDLGRVNSSEASAISQILSLIIEGALRQEASDIHIEPTGKGLDIRYRVDGRLLEVETYDRSYERGLLTKIKVDARMRSDNFLVPDSGVLEYTQADGKKVDIRVEIGPTAWGSSAVLRLQQNIWRELDGLGFSEHNLRRVRSAMEQPHGVLLAVGPTGSGKTTLLYSILREKIAPERKIITLENPVEYRVDVGVEQIQTNEAQGMTFAGGLRSVLRRDPEVILVGEIRDQETAETAVDAAMTGHLVLSTLHTNDAPGVIPRLIRMHVEPFMVSSSLLCVVSQRLVRKLCEHCRVPIALSSDEIAAAGFDPDTRPATAYEGNPEGCSWCNDGFSGRIPVHEVMLIGNQLAEAIAANAPQEEIVRLARAAGMTTMREDGWEKIQQGITSLAELNASTRRDLV